MSLDMKEEEEQENGLLQSPFPNYFSFQSMAPKDDRPSLILKSLEVSNQVFDAKSGYDLAISRIPFFILFYFISFHFFDFYFNYFGEVRIYSKYGLVEPTEKNSISSQIFVLGPGATSWISIVPSKNLREGTRFDGVYHVIVDIPYFNSNGQWTVIFLFLSFFFF